MRLLESIISYAKEKNIPGLLLFLDFEKVFDTIEWPFIGKTLNYFGTQYANELVIFLRGGSGGEEQTLFGITISTYSVNWDY